MSLVSLVLAAVVALGCDGTAIDVQDVGADTKPACELVALPLATVTPRHCLYQIPPGIDCSTIRIFADGVEVPADSLNLVCAAGQVVVTNCDGKMIAFTNGCVP